MKKEARGFSHDPKFVAQQIRDIIDVMVGRMSLESQQNAYPNLRARIQDLNIPEMAGKNQPGGSSTRLSF